jgi:glycosyltransferase involved in cell wall biosynthesis
MKTTRPHTLVITTEHASTGKMGGIGSYNAETQLLADGTLFLLVDDSVEEAAGSIIPCGTYVANNFPNDMPAYTDMMSRDYIILHVVRDILQKNPSITQVATHEYSGIGSRVAEASRTGCLPENIKMRIHCHGGHVQLERATDSWLGTYLDTLNAERSSIENADEVWFPGSYLYELYRAAGIRMDDDRVKFLGLPYRLSEKAFVEDITFAAITNIAFIGRMNKLKGYDVFSEVLADIFGSESPYRTRIKTVTAIGGDDNSMSTVRKNVKELVESVGAEYIQSLKTREETLGYIRQHVTDTLFILPYFSDNYSVAMLEIIDAAGPLLVLNTGGNAELVHDELWTRKRLADDTAQLKEKVRYYLALPNQDRRDECLKLRRVFTEEQKGRNKANEALFSSIKWRRKRNSSKAPIDIANVYVDGESSMVPEGWCRMSENSGAQDRPFDGRPTHVFLSRREITYDPKDLRDTLRAAIETGGRDQVYSIGFRNGERVGLLRNGSLGQFIQDPQGLMANNLCMPISMYRDMIMRYGSRQCVNRSGAEFFFAAATYALYSQNIRILPIPKLVGSAQHSIISQLNYDNMIFADFAHFQEKPQWEPFRYAAILLHNKTQEAGVVQNRVFVDYGGLLSSPDKAGRLARKVIRAQLRLISAAKKVWSASSRQ